ncbi:hypothetical protein XA68_13524 [Ophiocordyceps unilateralis]|uniref:Uncharacterized protein n=1 Tax=Ophiocordyceps unilateralis TaxID=268505 RepID=A0A2A9PNJ1_OPHUN|nr:hypothetical protein XA68_13524 [Ophiocordyceps unilateralis]
MTAPASGMATATQPKAPAVGYGQVAGSSRQFICAVPVYMYSNPSREDPFDFLNKDQESEKEGWESGIVVEESRGAQQMSHLSALCPTAVDGPLLLIVPLPSQPLLSAQAHKQLLTKR